jgi:hypothetical protein
MSDSDSAFSPEYASQKGTEPVNLGPPGVVEPTSLEYPAAEEVQKYGVNKPKRWVLKAWVTGDAG